MLTTSGLKNDLFIYIHDVCLYMHMYAFVYLFTYLTTSYYMQCTKLAFLCMMPHFLIFNAFLHLAPEFIS